MSILYDEGQLAIAENAASVLAARYDKSRLLALLEQTGGHDETFWRTCIDQGWTALAVPEEHGGLGLCLIELGIVAQACGGATSGAPFLLTNYAALEALLLSGDSAAQAQWLPGLAAGEAIGTAAFSEGNDPLPHAIGVRFADGALNGAKRGVTAGLNAQFAVVLAEGDGGAVLAVASLEGVARTAIDGFDNSRGYADLCFEATPATPIAQGPQALSIAREVLCRLAVATAHEQLGGAEALMFMARDYALERKAFGQPIGAFQSVKHRIAELYTLVELARANCIHAAACVGDDAAFLKAAAAARLSATEAYDTAARDCVQIHGGVGVTWEQGLHLHMRRARSLAVECGNMFGWEDVLAWELVGSSRQIITHEL